MLHNWTFMLDIGLLSIALLLATILKRKIKFFQKFLVPNSIIAGLICFAFANIFKGRFLLPETMEELVYHLLNLGFICLSLKNVKATKSSEIQASGAFQIGGYIIQGLVGFSLSIFLANTLFPSLFPGFGLLLPLGFGQGPGQATSIGGQWAATPGIDFPGGGNIGMTIAAIGFLWACFVGVPLMNVLIKKYKKTIPLKEKIAKPKAQLTDDVADEYFEDDHSQIPLGDSIDRLSVQISLIGLIYVLTYATIFGITSLLNNLGSFASTVGNMLWGFSFIFGSVYAILVRTFINKILLKTKLMSKVYIDSFLLQRIAGFSFDFMVAASIAGISLFFLGKYLWPTLIVTTIGGIVTIFYCIYFGKMIYKTSPVENIVGQFGTLTGTISSGMSLIREVDPMLQTSAANNLVFGGAAAIVFGAPLMVVLNIPIKGYVDGNFSTFYLTLAIFVVYFALMIFLMRLFTKKKAR